MRTEFLVNNPDRAEKLMSNSIDAKTDFLKDFSKICEKYGLRKVLWMEDKKAKTSTYAYHICALYLDDEEINGSELLRAMNVM